MLSMAYINSVAEEKLNDIELRRKLFPEVKDDSILDNIPLSDVIVRLVDRCSIVYEGD